jgi:hypothetical protein
MLFPKLLKSLLQTCYGILLLHVGLLHLVVVSHHSFIINLETFKTIVSFLIELIELIELGVFMLKVFSFPNNMFYFCQLVGQV